MRVTGMPVQRADDLGDLLGVDLLLDQGVAVAWPCRGASARPSASWRLRSRSSPYWMRAATSQFACALGLLELDLLVVDLLLELLDRAERADFSFSQRAVRPGSSPELGAARARPSRAAACWRGVLPRRRDGPRSRSGAASCGGGPRRARRASSRSRCAAGWPPRRSGRSPCRAGSGR